MFSFGIEHIYIYYMFEYMLYVWIWLECLDKKWVIDFMYELKSDDQVWKVLEMI